MTQVVNANWGTLPHASVCSDKAGVLINPERRFSGEHVGILLSGGNTAAVNFGS